MTAKPMSQTFRRYRSAALGMLLGCAFPIPLHASVWVPEGTAQTPTDTPSEQDAKMAWWREARLGLFIHWGLYSIPAGEWNGRQIGGLGEWIIKTATVPVADYQALAPRFNPTGFNAEQWVSTAKNAGMKYIIVTAKHHDGFAMFKSKTDPFNVYDATPFKRDPLAELAFACRKAGMRFGFYYSHDQDWTAPGGAVIGKTWDKAQDGNFEDYVRTKSIPQFKELLANYQPAPDIIWFDTPTTEMTPQLAKQYIELLKQHPKIIWNERLGGGFKGNFRTPENEIPVTGPAEDWEFCMTINNTWGFKKNDRSWKSTESLIRDLIDVTSKGGNYLLNVGPDSEGVIPAPAAQRLAGIGLWLAVNGGSIYGTTASPFKKAPSWGRVTRKSNRLYLHVFKWPQDGKLLLPVSNAPGEASLLSVPGSRLATTSHPHGIEITLPGSAPDPVASVIAIDFDRPIMPVLPPVTPQADDGTVVLTAEAADITGEFLRVEPGKKPGDVPNLGYWERPAEFVEWSIRVTRPGWYTPSLNYACSDTSAGSDILFSVGDQKLSGIVESSGDWDQYRTATLGQIRLEKGDRVTATLKVTRKKEFGAINLRSITLLPPVP
ncbi:MAG: alpha-L-fucosidase [Luteolibacter sp.]